MYNNDPLTATKANTRTHTDRALQHASAPERAVARSEVHLMVSSSTHGICTTTTRSGNQGHTHAPTLRRDGKSHTRARTHSRVTKVTHVVVSTYLLTGFMGIRVPPPPRKWFRQRGASRYHCNSSGAVHRADAPLHVSTSLELQEQRHLRHLPRPVAPSALVLQGARRVASILAAGGLRDGAGGPQLAARGGRGGLARSRHRASAHPSSAPLRPRSPTNRDDAAAHVARAR